MDTPLSESRFADVLEGWVDEKREVHDEHDLHAAHDDHDVHDDDHDGHDDDHDGHDEDHDGIDDDHDDHDDDGKDNDRCYQLSQIVYIFCVYHFKDLMMMPTIARS